MKADKVFKIVIVYNSVDTEDSFIVVAENEKDARDFFDSSVTGFKSINGKIVSCEYIGNLSCIVDENMKNSWRDDGN